MVMVGWGVRNDYNKMQKAIQVGHAIVPRKSQNYCWWINSITWCEMSMRGNQIPCICISILSRTCCNIVQCSMYLCMYCLHLLSYQIYQVDALWASHLCIRKDNSDTQASIWVLHPVDWPGFGEISDLEAPNAGSWQDGWYQRSSMVVKTQEKATKHLPDGI